MNLDQLVEPITELAIEAGNAILTVYATDFDVESKSDESPLTQADLASHNCIVAGLKALTPDIPPCSGMTIPTHRPMPGTRRSFVRRVPAGCCRCSLPMASTLCR